MEILLQPYSEIFQQHHSDPLNFVRTGFQTLKTLKLNKFFKRINH